MQTPTTSAAAKKLSPGRLEPAVMLIETRFSAKPHTRLDCQQTFPMAERVVIHGFRRSGPAQSMSGRSASFQARRHDCRCWRNAFEAERERQSACGKCGAVQSHLVNFRSLWLDCNKNARIWSLESYLITPFDTGGADDHRSRQLGSRL